ncbi:GH1 family beta-glucosidase [Thiocapsa sp.]|uniref:GH1 family beta-glucosidase n=1 Tax=Thiocapsa sp. TaxID=2024551 RepID=UPI002B7B6B64|nr:GH1 family beta-glucosidase [Thiocapsa sp.]HSO83943.1 GH1 family beta-glucosidase [Thiocapsa sp.]
MRIQFPENLTWGAATAAFQIEGAPDVDGKAPSIWDRFTARPGCVQDGSHAGVACDHYRRCTDDLDLMATLGLGAYRFSISWPRVIGGPHAQPNRRGLDFYDRLVDGLLERGIRPFVTLYHWDLPWFEEQRGGWEARATVWRFADYAEVVARRLGDRVKHWVTVNEPLTVVAAGYVSGDHAPGRRNPLMAFRVAHHLLLAHGAALQRLRGLVPDAQVGPALNLFPVIPRRRGDVRIAERIDALANRLFADPILAGRYPNPVRRLLSVFNWTLRPGDLDLIGQPVDFVGVNHYSRIIIERSRLPWLGFRLARSPDPNAVHTDMDWEIYPRSFLDTLTWLRERYDNPPVYITENGAAFADRVEADGSVQDPARRDYLEAYLFMLRKALDAGSDIRGYFVWSLLDNFEWALGLSKRFGLVHIDYDTLKRTPKSSAYWYASVCRTGGFDLPDPMYRSLLATALDDSLDLIEEHDLARATP